MSKLALLVFFIVAFSCLVPQRAYAATIFQDDFNSYPDGSFPNKWVNFNSTCNTNWKVENGILKLSISQNGCGMHLIPNSSEWPSLKDKYIFEADMRFISGVDSHLSYRINPQTSFIHVLHFITPGDFVLDTDNQNYNTFVGRSYQYNTNYHFKIIVESNRVRIYESDINNPALTLIRDIDFITPLPDGLIGLGSSPGSSVTTETWFDNVKISTIDDESKLNVPLLKQTDPLWANDQYDSASLWSSGQTGMGDWGCAVTSAAMVFQYNGVNKMPDNTALTPGTLNSWLKGAPDGYIRNGLLNWLALSRIAKLAKPNNSYSFDALEYNRINGQDDAALNDYIKNKIPGIIETPHHFVVATGTDSANTTFFINDPYFDRTTLADTYNKSYLALGTYTPANSDLSYIMMVINSNVVISLTDEQGNSKGESFIQEPIAGQIDSATNSRGSVKIFYLKKPQSGKYTLKLKSNTQISYQLDKYFYDKNGNYSGGTITGALSNGTTDTYILNFDKNSATNSKLMKITFDYLKQEIIDLYNQKKIKNIVTYKALLEELNLAKVSKTKILTKALLDVMIVTIKGDKKIDSTTAGILIGDIQSLKNSL